MARINLSEGQPLTYELINQIVTKVNSITSPENDDEDSPTNVEFDVPGDTGKNIVKVVAGHFPFTIKSKDINEVIDINFPKGNFSNDNVVVVVSVADAKIAKDKGGIQMATTTITRANRQGFSARVQIIKSEKTNSTFRLHYIAIGVGAAKSNS